MSAPTISPAWVWRPGTRAPADLESCMIDIPASMPFGHWDLEVIANGIAWDPLRVRIASRVRNSASSGKSKL